MKTLHQNEFTRLRESAQLTLEEAAEFLKVSLRQAYRYENGESSPLH